MKILVTGSSGTIGTRLCEVLLRAGHDVCGVDIRPNEWSSAVAARTVLADLRDARELRRKIRGRFGLLIHLAANARVFDLVIDPGAALDNITMTFNALEFARRRRVGRFMFASSREVYGNIRGLVHKESDASIDACESPYAASKVAGEALVRSYDKCYGVRSVIFRFSNVYGMYDRSDRLVPNVIRRARRGVPIILHGQDKRLDFTYIDDCIRGIRCAIAAFGRCAGQTINIATGTGTTLRRACDLIIKATGSRSKLVSRRSRVGEVRRYAANLEKAGNLLGYKPEVGIAEGLRRSVDWWDRYSRRERAAVGQKRRRAQ